MMASSLYHPDTAQRSLAHDGSGPEPGLKALDGHWDLRPHLGRVVSVTDETLRTWRDILEEAKVPVRETAMVFTVNRSISDALRSFVSRTRVGGLDVKFSQGWNETTDVKRALIESHWSTPDSWDDVILQGPHISVETPFYKSPNESMLHNLDWSMVDLEALPFAAVPITCFRPVGDRYRYDCSYTEWGTEDKPTAARDYYRLAWRKMAANTGERTLIPAIIPPGAAHIGGIYSLGLPDAPLSLIVLVAAQIASLVSDLTIRVAPKANIQINTISRMAVVVDHPLTAYVVHRSLRLNCITEAYSKLWSGCYMPAFSADNWATGEFQMRPTEPLSTSSAIWDKGSPLRRAVDRRQGLVELDALVAMMFEISVDQLCAMYRTQFPVLYGRDRGVYYYDVNGRLVPNSIVTAWRTKGDRLTVDECTATNQAGNTYTYELPFVTLDREADMRQAYAYFEEKLRSSS